MVLPPSNNDNLRSGYVKKLAIQYYEFTNQLCRLFNRKKPPREAVIRAIKDIYAMRSDPDIDEKDVYYSIADLMFLVAVSNDGKLEDLCSIAGQLELPDHHITNKKKLMGDFELVYSSVISKS
ncbi:MAG: hypothetical protein WCI47_03440 [bacterium]